MGQEDQPSYLPTSSTSTFTSACESNTLGWRGRKQEEGGDRMIQSVREGLERNGREVGGLWQRERED